MKNILYFIFTADKKSVYSNNGKYMAFATPQKAHNYIKNEIDKDADVFVASSEVKETDYVEWSKNPMLWIWDNDYQFIPNEIFYA